MLIFPVSVRSDGLRLQGRALPPVPSRLDPENPLRRPRRNAQTHLRRILGILGWTSKRGDLFRRIDFLFGYISLIRQD